MGFVGKNLVRELVSQHHVPIILIRNGQEKLCTDLFDGRVKFVSVKNLMEDADYLNVSAVVNLAGKYWFEPNIEQIKLMIDSNIELPALIAERITRGGKNVTWIQASTFMQHFNSAIYDPTCFYAATKQSTEVVLKAFYDRGLLLKTLVLPHIFGEHDQRGKLLTYLIDQVSKSRAIKISSGRQIMDLVHVTDVVKAIIKCLSDDLPCGRYQVSSNKEITILEILDHIAKQVEIDIDVEVNASEDRPRDTFEIWKCAPLLPGWGPSVDVFQWITSQLDAANDAQ